VNSSCVLCGKPAQSDGPVDGVPRCDTCRNRIGFLVARLVDRLARNDWSDWPVPGRCEVCGNAMDRVASIDGARLCLACAEARVSGA